MYRIDAATRRVLLFADDDSGGVWFDFEEVARQRCSCGSKDCLVELNVVRQIAAARAGLVARGLIPKD